MHPGLKTGTRKIVIKGDLFYSVHNTKVDLKYIQRPRKEGLV